MAEVRLLIAFIQVCNHFGSISALHTMQRSSISAKESPTTTFIRLQTLGVMSQESTSLQGVSKLPLVEMIDHNNRSNNSDYNQYITAPAPAVNLSAFDFKLNMLNVTWNATSKQGSVPLKASRHFLLAFSCSASYPVEWLCEKPSGAVTWDVEEIRDFKPRSYSSNFSFESQDLQLESIYTAILKLTYEKPYNIPEKLELNCARARRSEKYQSEWEMTYSLLDISRDVNDTLYVDVVNNTTRNGSLYQHREILGQNVDCRVDLQWIESNHTGKNFKCKSAEHSNVIDFNTDELKCYDAASCERMYTNSMNCRDETPKEIVREIWPSQMWVSAPPTGVVFCLRDDDKANWDWNKNRAEALHFVHSLPPICQEDSFGCGSRDLRNKLYVGADVGIPKDRYTLEKGFMSFCWTPRSYETEIRDWKVYAGENVSVTCIGSIYHFAKGTRIGIVRTQQNTQKQQELWEYARIVESSTEFRKVDGFFNYTAKVHINSTDVSKLFCETFLKQMEGYIRKYIPIRVYTQITFVGNAQVALWNYTGQRNFELRCETHGDPPPIIKWKYQGKMVPSPIEEKTTSSEQGSKVMSILRFPSHEDLVNVSVAELQGTYTCEAFNKFDRNVKTFFVGFEVAKGDSTWILWVVISIIVIAIITLILFLVWKIKLQRKALRLLSKVEVDEFIFGRPEFLQQYSSLEEVNNYASFLPYNQSYEISKEQLEIDENTVLGSGAYAIVLRGTLKRKDGERVQVAIKTARTMDDICYFKALLSELKIMGFIGMHPNIINLEGAHTKNIKNREVFIAIEFCENGNLLNFLQDHRNRFKTLVGIKPDGEDFLPPNLKKIYINMDSYVNSVNELNTMTLIKWAYEIANGMEFLSQKNVIHGDLAARNILLNEYLTAKIGDFGLSRQLFEYSNYIKKQRSPLPWKWLAIECLQDMRFSVKSDVWAYGQVPFAGHSYNDEFIEALVKGKRPNRPINATNRIYSFMTTFWRDNPEDRPNFTHICEFFHKLLLTPASQEYLELHEKCTSTTSNTNINISVELSTFVN